MKGGGYITYPLYFPFAFLNRPSPAILQTPCIGMCTSNQEQFPFRDARSNTFFIYHFLCFPYSVFGHEVQFTALTVRLIFLRKENLLRATSIHSGL